MQQKLLKCNAILKIENVSHKAQYGIPSTFVDQWLNTIELYKNRKKALADSNSIEMIKHIEQKNLPENIFQFFCNKKKQKTKAQNS